MDSIVSRMLSLLAGGFVGAGAAAGLALATGVGGVFFGADMSDTSGFKKRK
jgi:hypothetical protein